MQSSIPTAMEPRGWRRAKLLAGTVALTMGVFGSLAAVTAGTASATTFPAIQTASYQIGTTSSSVGTPTVSPSSANQGTPTNFTVTFTTPVAVAPTNTSPTTFTLYLAPVNGAAAFLSGATNIGLADINTGYITTSGATASASSIVVPVNGTGAINAGDTLVLTFTATTPSLASSSTPNTYNFTVGTSASGILTSGSSNTFTVNFTGSSAVVLTTTTNAKGTYDPFTLTNLTSSSFTLLTGTSTTNTFVLTVQDCTGSSAPTAPCTGTAPNSGTGGYAFSFAPQSYTLTDTSNPNVTFTITAANPISPGTTAGAGGVALTGYASTTTTAPASTDNLKLSGSGINVNASQTEWFLSQITQGSNSSPFEVSNSETFGGSVSGVTVSASNTAASTPSNYTVGFTASSSGKMPTTTGGDSITIAGPGSTSFTGVTGGVVTDNTSKTSFVFGTSNTSVSSSGSSITINMPSFAVGNGDSLTVTLFGVKNPTAGSYSGANGLSVSTAADPVPVTNATAYTIGPSVTSTGVVTVTVTPNTPGTSATYTVGPFTAASALVGGTDLLQIDACPSTATVPCGGGAFGAFPASATLTDNTTASGTQTITAVAGAGSNEVQYKLANNVAASDSLTLTIAGAVNPVAGTYTMFLGANSVTNNANTAGLQGLGTPALTFPQAYSSQANGTIVFYGGAAYVFAGGHAFGVASPAQLAAVQAVDPAKILTAPTGTTAPTTAAREGTLVIVAGAPTIYVVHNGQLYGFASPSQIFAGGFDAADIITIPNLGGMTVNSSSAAAAGLTGYNTSSDGAVVNSSGTYYIFAGGKAFGIPTPAALSTIEASIPGATSPSSVGWVASTGTVGSTQTGATMASGVLVTIGGAVYVTFAGPGGTVDLFPFKSMTQLQTDGYGGTPSITLWSIAGFTVAQYTGS